MLRPQYRACGEDNDQYAERTSPTTAEGRIEHNGRTKHIRAGAEARMKIDAMLWIVVFILVALAFLFPKTRAFSLSAIGVAIVAIVAIVVIAKRQEPIALGAAAPPAVQQKPVDFERFHIDNLDKADPEAKNRIRVEEIRFDQIRAKDGVERGSIGTIVARLYNDSATYTLTDYGYNLVVQDCIKSVCTTVFDQHGQSAASVPPNQARDVEIAIRAGSTRDLPPIKILGTAHILLTPSDTRAELAGPKPADQYYPCR
jgi:hypothetical protein